MSNTQDIPVTQFVINKLTKLQFESAEINDTELYVVTDDKIQDIRDTTGYIVYSSDTPYIVDGSTLTIRAGLTYMVPNGYNSKGQFVNTEVTLMEDLTISTSGLGAGANIVLFLSSTGSAVTKGLETVLYAQTQPSTIGSLDYYYVADLNKWVDTTGTLEITPLFTFSMSATSTIENFTYYNGVIQHRLNTDLLLTQMMMKADDEDSATALSLRYPNALIYTVDE